MPKLDFPQIEVFSGEVRSLKFRCLSMDSTQFDLSGWTAEVIFTNESPNTKWESAESVILRYNCSISGNLVTATISFTMTTARYLCYLWIKNATTGLKYLVHRFYLQVSEAVGSD